MKNVAIFLCLFSIGVSAQTFQWKQVSIGGGGYCLDVQSHPVEADLCYAAVDVAGLLKWNSSQKTWENLNGWVNVDSSHLYGCDGFALDRNNPVRIYVIFGKYACYSGGIFRSDDYGAHWIRLKTLRAGSNQNLREVQSSLAVDPNHSQRVYCGTRTQGLLVSSDAGSTWQLHADVLKGDVGDSTTCYWSGQPIGIRSLAIDPSVVLSGKSQRIYVAVYGVGVYRSNDGGASFQLLSGSPLTCVRLAVYNNGVYATADQGVFIFNGSTWSNITPNSPVSPFFNGISVDPFNQNRLICATAEYAFNQETFLSNDAGASWTKLTVGTKSVPQFKVPWFQTNKFQAATSFVYFDPKVQHRVFLGDWYSVWRTDQIGATTIQWVQQNKGYEVTVNLHLCTPPKGTSLLSGFADVVGFRHSLVDSFPSSRLYSASECTGIDYCEKNALNVAAVISDTWDGTNTRILRSVNGGVGFVVQNIPPGSKNGKIAIASNDSLNLVYLPANDVPYYSIDGGATWTASTGVPANAINTNSIFQYNQPLLADRSTANTFYVYRRSSGRLYKSTDKGATFTQINTTLPTSTTADFCNLIQGYTTTSKLRFWISIGTKGLWSSSDGGVTFVKDSYFSIARMCALGHRASNAQRPILYVYGKHAGICGVYLSEDEGSTYTRINTDETLMGDEPTAMAADRQTERKVYVGTNGTGIYYGTEAVALQQDCADWQESSSDIQMKWTNNDLQGFYQWTNADRSKAKRIGISSETIILKKDSLPNGLIDLQVYDSKEQLICGRKVWIQRKFKIKSSTRIAPNPFHDVVQIDGFMPNFLSLYTVQGVFCKRLAVEKQIDLSDLIPGTCIG